MAARLLCGDRNADKRKRIEQKTRSAKRTRATKAPISANRKCSKTTPRLRKRKAYGCILLVQKCRSRKNALRQVFRLEKRERSCYGNDGCDGFSPNFPLIPRWQEPQYAIGFEDSIAQKTPVVKRMCARKTVVLPEYQYRIPTVAARRLPRHRLYPLSPGNRTKHTVLLRLRCPVRTTDSNTPPFRMAQSG